MDAKLKSLKVVELKDILQKANVTVPAKANKQDLIAKILGSSAAIEVYNKQQNPTAADDLLAPPEDFDWDADESAPPAKEAPASKPPVAEPVKAAKPQSKAAAKPPSKAATKPASKAAPTPAAAVASDITPAAAENAADSNVVDEELEKRKKRAERFGIPLVEKPKPRQRALKPAASGGKAKIEKTADSEEKLTARAARFGTGKLSEPAVGKKRAVEETVDPEEAERRKKRAERFGGGVAA